MKVEKKQKKYAWNATVSNVVGKLATCGKLLDAWEQQFIEGVPKFGMQHGYLTFKQMSKLGKMSQKYLQDGKRMHNGWWNGELVEYMEGNDNIIKMPEVKWADPSGTIVNKEFEQETNKPEYTNYTTDDLSIPPGMLQVPGTEKERKVWDTPGDVGVKSENTFADKFASRLKNEK